MILGDEILIAILSVGVAVVVYNRGQQFGELKERVDGICRRLDEIKAKQDSDALVIAEVTRAVARLETDACNSNERVRRLEDLQGRVSDDIATIKQALVQFAVGEVPKSAPKAIGGGEQPAVGAVRLKESGKTLRTLAKIGFRALVGVGLLKLTLTGIPVPDFVRDWVLS